MVIKKKSLELDAKDYKTEDIVIFALLLFLLLIVGIVQFIYIFFSFKYAPQQIVPLSYLLIVIALSIKGKLTKKNTALDSFSIPTKTKTKKADSASIERALIQIDKSKEDLTKISIWNRLKSLIDCCFFGYMLYILFII